MKFSKIMLVKISGLIPMFLLLTIRLIYLLINLGRFPKTNQVSLLSILHKFELDKKVLKVFWDSQCHFQKASCVKFQEESKQNPRL